MCKPEVLSPEAVNALSDDAIAAKLKCRLRVALGGTRRAWLHLGARRRAYSGTRLKPPTPLL